MSDHLSIDEIMEFCSAKRTDSTFFTLATRVNSHIMKCEKCREKYNAFLDAGNIIDKIGEENAISHMADNQMERQLGKIREQLRNAGLSIRSFVSGWEGLILKVQTLRSLEYDMFGACARLYHPSYVAVAKSIGQSGSARALCPPVIKSTLTDGKGSRLSVGEDGTLSFFVKNAVCDMNTLAVLVPEKEEGSLFFQYLEPYDSSTFTARFENVVPGKYFASLFTLSTADIDL